MFVYTVCLVVGLMFTIFCAIAGHFFGGHDGDVGGAGHDIGTGGHAEAGYDHSGIHGISFFSPTVLASFVTAFGAFGVIFTKIPATSSVWASAPLSGAGAVGIAWGVLLLFNAMFKRMQGSSEGRVSRLIGVEANVITPIPAGGVGEIAYVQSDSRYTAPARTENGEPLAKGQIVRISRIVGSQFFVELAKKS